DRPGAGNRARSNLAAEESEVIAENAEENLGAPLRDPPRALRLTTFTHHARTTKSFALSSEHFRVTYPDDTDRRDANQVLTILENARADYLRRAANASISITGLPFLEIRANDSTGNFVGRTGQPWWAAAATKGNRIELQPIAILKRRGTLNTTLRHEL